MSKKIDVTTQNAIKLVENALELDSNNCNKEAYIKYLESISYITSCLLGNRTETLLVESSCLTRPQIRKLVSVARQCLDRIETLFEEWDDNIAKVDSSLQKEPATSPGLQVTASTTISKVDHKEPVRRPSLAVLPKTKNSAILEAIDWVSPEEPAFEAEFDVVQEPSPLEKAKVDNEVLINKYQARLRTVSRPELRANLRLELQRRMTDNLQLARRRQDAYVRQMKEQKRHRLEKATQSAKESGSTAWKRLLPIVTETLEYEQNQKLFSQLRTRVDEHPDADGKFVTMVVKKTLQDLNHPLTKQLHICTHKIHNKIHPLVERGIAVEPNNNFKESVSSPLAIHSSFEHFVSRTSSQNKSRQCTTDNLELQVELEYGTDVAAAAAEDFAAMYQQNSEEVQLALTCTNDKIAAMKKELKKQNSVLRKSSLKKLKVVVEKQVTDDVEEIAPLAVEESGSRCPNLCEMEMKALTVHFKDIVTFIHESVDNMVEMFVLVYGQPFERDEAKEVCYALIEEQFFPTFWPSLMNLCRIINESQEQEILKSMEDLEHCSLCDLGYSGSPPCYSHNWQEAIQILKQVPNEHIPTKKLGFLVKVAKLICKCECPRTDGLSGDHNTGKSISADDLIPLLSFTCIRAMMPQLVSECYLLESLIHQRNLMGEEGYCLTSLHTSLQYILTIERPITFHRLESTV